MKNLNNSIHLKRVKEAVKIKLLAIIEKYDIELMSNDYISLRTPLKFKCNKCLNIFYVKPRSILEQKSKTTPCKKCIKTNIEKEMERKITIIKQLFKMLNYDILKNIETINPMCSKQKLTIKCNNGHTFKRRLSDLFRFNCPCCKKGMSRRGLKYYD